MSVVSPFVAQRVDLAARPSVIPASYTAAGPSVNNRRGDVFVRVCNGVPDLSGDSVPFECGSNNLLWHSVGRLKYGLTILSTSS
jgi:hypothetical protein